MRETNIEKDEHIPELRIMMADGERCLSFVPGMSVFAILESANIHLRAACGGIGTCGQCRVRIAAGVVNEPTPAELNCLTPAHIQQGIRLACQVRPVQDVRLWVECLAPRASWRSLSANEYIPIEVPLPRVPAPIQKNPSYGVAVDLGTTHIRLSLWDLVTRQRLAGCAGLNPQNCFGADVLTRLTSASESPRQALKIAQLAREAIKDALEKMLSEGGWDRRNIGSMTIVGNTAMLALLTEQNYHLLLRPEYWMRPLACQPQETISWKRSWGLADKARIEVVQPLAGFVGSDLLAGALATRLTCGTAGTLLVDFGTNSEIALWDGAVLWMTSAAGGPAFEGCGISCGMPAEPGAIYRVEPENDLTEMLFAVIGGEPACGICGSGLVDVIGSLRQAETLNRHGIFRPPAGKQGVVILPDRPDLVVKQRDIDLFQRAKAAVGAGIACLLQQAGVNLKDIARIYVCGAFGRFLNITNAQAIGLLPNIAPQRIELCENAALTGAELLLLSRESADRLEAMRTSARLINLSTAPCYEDLFIAHLSLQPMPMA